MGAGKSTVGRLLAARLGTRFADSDEVVAQRAGRSVAEIFASDGEGAFRALERAVVEELVTAAGAGDDPAGVVALGGGAVQDRSTRALLRSALVAYLEVSYAEVLTRVGGDGSRPVLSRPDLEEVYAARREAYREVADLTVLTDGLDAPAVVDAVAQAIAAGAGDR